MEIYFAPIQGFTDFVYRNAHAKYFSGVDKYFTPFLRVEKSSVRPKDVKDLISSSKYDNPHTELVPQIIANSRQDIESLLQVIENQGFNKCDLNFGCPFPQQSKKYRGAGIWDKPEKVSEVLDVLKDYPNFDFSLKMRIGNTSPSQTLDLVDVINSCKFRFVTIHPRLGKQMYSGDVDLDTFKILYSRLQHPIVYNGDIRTVSDIENISRQFPNLKGVMIGRGLLANPFLAENFKNQESDFDKSRFLKFQEELLAGYLAEYGNSEFMALDKMKTFWQYAPERTDSKNLKSIQKSRSISEFRTFVSIAVNKL